jgi:hypothetical protein
MEYDDASGEITGAPRKWGGWFNSVRKDDEGDEENWGEWSNAVRKDDEEILRSY